MASRFGRDELEWNELVDATERYLVERARLERTTNYTELNAVLVRRTGQPGFDFDKEVDRAAIGAVLGEVATRSFAADGIMLSSIVIYLRENDAGGGFYRLAEKLGAMPAGASSSRRMEFWMSHVNKSFDRYRRE